LKKQAKIHGLEGRRNAKIEEAKRKKHASQERLHVSLKFGGRKGGRLLLPRENLKQNAYVRRKSRARPVIR